MYRSIKGKNKVICNVNLANILPNKTKKLPEVEQFLSIFY